MDEKVQISSVVTGVKKERKKVQEEYKKRTIHEAKEEVLASEVARLLLLNNVDGAWNYLNRRFVEEIVDDCQNQEFRSFSLETVLVKRKNKYAPFYERIGKAMPENLCSLSADDLCKLLGVENLHIKDSENDNDPVIPMQTKKEKKKEWRLVIILALVGAIVWLVLEWLEIV
jgi:hypothetical protein